MEKLLTVIIPSYNMEKYLPKCLGSLVVDDPRLLQKLDVIVVNDGSKDRTSEIAHEFEKKYPGVFCVIDKANGHYGSCVNAGLAVAKGTFVKVLDADDYFETSAFIHLSTTLLKYENGDIDLVVSDYAHVTIDGKISRDVVYRLEENMPYTVDKLLDGVVCPWTGLHAITYRRSILGEIGYRQTEGCAYTDLEWMLLPMRAVRRFCYTRGPVYMYRLGRDGQTMDPVQYAKGFGIVLNITNRWVEEYKKHAKTMHEANCAYIENVIKARIAYAYRQCLVEEMRVPDVDQKLEAFELRLKAASPALYEYAGNVPFSDKLVVRFVKIWRKHKRFNCFRLACLRRYVRMRVWLRKRSK